MGREQFIGTSPAGVEYVCYWRNGETPESFDARARRMAARLVEHHARHDSKRVRVRGLSVSAFDKITVELERAREAGAPYEGVTEGRTFIEATRGDLRTLADELEASAKIDLDDAPDFIRGSIMVDLSDDALEARVEFGVRSVRRSWAAVVKRIRAAAK